MALFKRDSTTELLALTSAVGLAVPVAAPVKAPAHSRAAVPCSTEEAALALGQEAATLLGYTGLAVVQAFKKLGIEPLDVVKVQEYKRKAASDSHYEWHSTELAKYGKPVPEFALSRAIELKRELPSAAFYVEELRFNPDPFLYLQVGSTRYYLDVWDEPKFEGRRTV